MSADELKLLKQYMHVDHDDDDALIQKLWSGSVGYLSRGGVSIDDSDDYWFAAAALTLQKYDGTPLPDGARQLINQLKMADPTF